MSAVAAVLTASREPIEAGDLAAMCAAASCPDSASYRLEARPGVAVAGCGSEPAELVAEAGGTVIAADARLDNRAELAVALGLPPSSPGGDARLLLAAYRRWGEGLVDQLVGDYAFVLWDETAEKLLCVRDPLGVRSLHYARCGSALLVASEAQQIIDHPGMSRHVDLRAVAAYLLLYGGDPAQSFYEDVAAVPAGHFLVSQTGRECVTRYWRSEEIELERMDVEEATERLRQLLWRAVEDRLEGSGPACGLLVSGGLDSSAVAAIATELLSEQGGHQHLAPFCFSFKELAACDESRYWRPLADHLGLTIEPIRGEPNGMLDAELRQWPESPMVGWQRLTDEALERLRLRRGKVLLTGLGGDSVVGGSACVYADRLMKGQLGVWREMAEHAAVRGGSFAGVLRYWGLRPLLPRTLRRHLAGEDGPRHVPEWIEPRWVRAVGLGRSRRDRPAEPCFSSRARRVIHGVVENLFGEQRAAQWYRRLGARHGIEVRHPFLDRRLVELVLATPPELLFRGGRYKQLLRRALGQRLPATLRDRAGRTSYGPYMDLSLRRRAGWVRELLRAPRLADLGILRMDRLPAELSDYLEGRSTRLGPHLWAMITAELWLGRCADAAVGGVPAALPTAGGGD